MNVREFLTFVIDGDAKGAIRAFNDVEAANTKMLGKAETATQKWSAGLLKGGAIAVTAGAAIGVGMFKAAESAGELELAMGRLQGIFGPASGEVEQFVKQANYLGLSDRAAAQAVTRIGEAAVGLGLSAGEAAKLTPELVKIITQLGLLNGMDTGAALETVNAAMRGEYDSLQRLVPTISNATIVQRAMLDNHVATEAALTSEMKTRAALALIIEDGTKTLERAGDPLESLAAKTAVAKANMEDAFTAIGTGAMIAVEPAITAIGDLAGAFNELPASAQSAVGAVGGVGAAVGIVGGLISMGIGTFLRFRQRLDELATTAPRVAGALGAIGKATALLGGIVAVTQVIGAFQPSARASEAELMNLQSRLLDLRKAASETDIAGALGRDLDSLAGDISKVNEMFFDTSGFENFANGIAGAFSSITGIEDPTQQTRDRIDDLDKTLATIAQTSGPAAERRFNQIRDAMIASGASGEEVDNVFDDYNATLVANREAAKIAAEMQTGLAEGTGEVVDVGARAKDTLENLTESVQTLEQAMGLGAVAGEAFGDAIERSTSVDDLIEGAAASGEAFTAFKESVKDLPDTIDQMKLATGGYNEEQTKSIAALTDAGQANQEYLAGLVEQGVASEDVKTRAYALRDAYADQMRQAGKTEEQIKTYQEVLGLTDPQIDTAIKLSGDAFAIAQLTILQGQIDKLDEGVQAEITALVLAGDVQGAVRKMQAELAQANLWVTVQARIAQPFNPFAPRTGGRTTQQAAQMSTYAAPGAPSHYVGAGSAITINMPAGADGPSVVRALRRYEQRNGSTSRGWRPT